MPDAFPGTGSEHCWGTGAFEHTSLEERLPQLQSETYLLPLVPQVTTVLLQTVSKEEPVSKAGGFPACRHT